MDDQQERDVALGLRQGRVEAWRALYEAYAEQVWRAVARLLGPDSTDVADVVQACCLAMDDRNADGQVFNVGTGRPISVLQVGELLARELGWTGGFEITRKFRAGDIRHCFADITRIHNAIGYTPRHAFEEGVRELVAWVAHQQSSRTNDADGQLAAYGLVR